MLFCSCARIFKSSSHNAVTMGGGPDKETVLIILWDPEPKAITAMLKRQFPHFDITYLQVAPRAATEWAASGNEVPDGE